MAKLAHWVRLFVKAASSPGVVWQRVGMHLREKLDRARAPLTPEAGFSQLVKAFRLTGLSADQQVSELWHRLGQQPFWAPTDPARELAQFCPEARARILELAEHALAHRVELLGVGPIELGEKLPWHTDFKTQVTWPTGFARDLKYGQPPGGGDVKIPWELSRLQWLVPAGQAYALTQDERYAQAIRSVLEDWLTQNPYAGSINWACTMEAALRIFTWIWFFHTCQRSQAWADSVFRTRFLGMLYLHGLFAERYLELSPINGNHFTADAASLVLAGLFFQQRGRAERWQSQGWALLEAELPRQVGGDGVDFEASVSYHRLVLELFYFPALYRQTLGLPVADSYRRRLLAMGRFVASYARVDGTSPLWGDADDARALPLGCQSLLDHRYLVGLLACTFRAEPLRAEFTGPLDEIYWHLGADACRWLQQSSTPAITTKSVAFAESGYYVLRSAQSHVFVDVAQVGLAGRGGHGHNDCLAFEAWLAGVLLVVDSGSYAYTGSYAERDHFRATARHNTPQVEDEEVNRFVGPTQIWSLHNDALPKVLRWEPGETQTVLQAEHVGYRRLTPAVRVCRTFTLHAAEDSLTVLDQLDQVHSRRVTIPWHFAPGVTLEILGQGEVLVQAQGRRFQVCWQSPHAWQCSVEPARVAPSYGLALPTQRLVWRCTGVLDAQLEVVLRPLASRGVIAK